MSQVSAVRDRSSGALDNVDPVNADYPDNVESGDTLVLLVSADSAVFDSASGWTTLVDGIVSGAGFDVLYRTADGSEAGSTFTYELTSAQDSSYVVLAVAGGNTPEAASATGSTNQPDPPSLSPSGGSGLYLWIACGAYDGARPIIDYPTDYESWFQTNNAGLLISTYLAERLLEAATEDPGVFTGSTSDGWITATVAIEVTQPDPSNFPAVETTATSDWTSDSTTQTMNLPAGIAAGDLLVAEISTDGTAAPSITGWTELGSMSNGVDVTATILYKEADGTEGATVSVTLDTAQQGTALVRRITGATTDNIEAAFSTTGGDDDHPAPPSLTPAGGSDSILWLVGASIDANGALPESLSLNYGAAPVMAQTSSVSSAETFSGVGAYAQATSTPSLMGIVNNEQWVAYTVAIYPEAAPPPPPPSGGNRMGGTGAIRRRGGFPR